MPLNSQIGTKEIIGHLIEVFGSLNGAAYYFQYQLHKDVYNKFQQSRSENSEIEGKYSVSTTGSQNMS